MSQVVFPGIPDDVDAVVTHGGCFDGFTARWVLADRWPDAECVDGVYGTFPVFAPETARGTLVIADFSYPRDDMIRLADEWEHIIVLDHHKTAAKHLVDLPANVACVFDMDRSGAGLVADWLDARYALVNYVEDRDLWRWELPDSKEVAAVFGITPFTFEDWSGLGYMLETRIGAVIARGEAVLARDKVIIDELVGCARIMNIGGYQVPVTPSPYALGSDVAGKLAEADGVPFAAYYRDLPDRREFGLRSRKDGVDVSVIAETYGGGGHPGASGFRVSPGHYLYPTPGASASVDWAGGVS